MHQLLQAAASYLFLRTPPVRTRKQQDMAIMDVMEVDGDGGSALSAHPNRTYVDYTSGIN